MTQSKDYSWKGWQPQIAIRTNLSPTLMDSAKDSATMEADSPSTMFQYSISTTNLKMSSIDSKSGRIWLLWLSSKLTMLSTTIVHLNLSLPKEDLKLPSINTELHRFWDGKMHRKMWRLFWELDLGSNGDITVSLILNLQAMELILSSTIPLNFLIKATFELHDEPPLFLKQFLTFKNKEHIFFHLYILFINESSHFGRRLWDSSQTPHYQLSQIRISLHQPSPCRAPNICIFQLIQALAKVGVTEVVIAINYQATYIRTTLEPL